MLAAEERRWSVSDMVRLHALFDGHPIQHAVGGKMVVVCAACGKMNVDKPAGRIEAASHAERG
jgi:hypothetical protein